ASAIGAISTEDAQLEALLTALQDDPEWNVRASAAEALGHADIHSKRVTASLVRVLEDEELIVQLTAAEALARLDPLNDAALIFLKDLASGRKQPGSQGERLREKAIIVLGLLGPTAKSAVPDLTELLVEKSGRSNQETLFAAEAGGLHLDTIRTLG